ncbi:MAG: hypothetical protein H6601_08380 [Flavobacteriales bacterium]|nr:hypothetical protein [Flavobacteriales bacterium]MCB9190246.1 hypothetical protein [Flavobacteriales bacterium]
MKTAFGLLLAFCLISGSATAQIDLTKVCARINEHISNVSNKDFTFVQNATPDIGTTINLDIKKTTDRGMEMNYSYRLDLSGIITSDLKEVTEGPSMYVLVTVSNPEQQLVKMRKGEAKGGVPNVKIAVASSEAASKLIEVLKKAMSSSDGGGAFSSDEVYGFQFELSPSEKCSALRPDFANQPYWIDGEACSLVKSFEKTKLQTMGRSTGLFSAEALAFAPGIKSNVRFKNGSKILVVVKVDPEGSDPSSLFTLLEFQKNERRGNREYIMGKATIGVTGTNMVGLALSYKKLANGYYLIAVDQPLRSGEYALSTPDFVYCFGID